MRGSSLPSAGHIPALDGLRGLCVLLVVAGHGGLGQLVPGGLGVIVFFAISGFLLTLQMIQEIEDTGRIKLRDFYLRRFFRLAPALLAYILFFTLLLSCLGAQFKSQEIATALFYFANYYRIFIGYGAHSPFPILWSLSVEEHYYIVFPLCMLLFRRELAAMLPWLCLLLLIALAWRIRLYTGCQEDSAWRMCARPGELRTDGTDAIFDCILYGAIAAFLYHYYPASVRRLFSAPGSASIALLGLLVSLLFRDPLFRASFRFSLQATCAAALILHLVHGLPDIFSKLLTLRPLIVIGKLSYSLYLSHYGVLVTMQAVQFPLDLHRPLTLFLYYGASFALAAASYYLLEKPMMATRRRFGAHCVP